MDDRWWSMASRLEVLAALLAALDHREQIMTIVDRAADAEAARAEVAETFGLSESASMAVLDMQVRRFAQVERSRVFYEWQELESDPDL